MKSLLLIFLVSIQCIASEKIPNEFTNGQSWPSGGEAQNSGEALMSIDSAYLADVTNMCRIDLIIKFEEGDCSDSKMTKNAKFRVLDLANRVDKEWNGKVKLRITEAWDNNNEHGKFSLHYEGRAVDLTTSDLDLKKYSRLASLAAEVGFTWVYFEGNHVHASVK